MRLYIVFVVIHISDLMTLSEQSMYILRSSPHLREMGPRDRGMDHAGVVRGVNEFASTSGSSVSNIKRRSSVELMRAESPPDRASLFGASSLYNAATPITKARSPARRVLRT